MTAAELGVEIFKLHKEQRLHPGQLKRLLARTWCGQYHEDEMQSLRVRLRKNAFYGEAHCRMSDDKLLAWISTMPRYQEPLIDGAGI